MFGGKPPEDAQNFRVHEILTAAAEPPRYASKAQWMKRRAELLARLKKNVFRAFPVHKSQLTVQPGDWEVPNGLESLRFELGHAPMVAESSVQRQRTVAPSDCYLIGDLQLWPR